MAKDVIIDRLKSIGDPFEKESPAPGYNSLDFQEPWNTDLALPDLDREDKELFKVKEYGTPISAWDIVTIREPSQFEIGDRVKWISGPTFWGTMENKCEISNGSTGVVISVPKDQSDLFLDWDNQPTFGDVWGDYSQHWSVQKSNLVNLEGDSNTLSWDIKPIESDPKKVNLLHAIYCAEAVLSIYEERYPNDNRPRAAIEAAKACLKNPTKENKDIVYDAAAYAGYAGYDAAYAADAAAYAAAYAAYAATYYAAFASYAIKYAKQAAELANKNIDFDSLRSKAENDIWEYTQETTSSLMFRNNLNLSWDIKPYVPKIGDHFSIVLENLHEIITDPAYSDPVTFSDLFDKNDFVVTIIKESSSWFSSMGYAGAMRIAGKDIGGDMISFVIPLPDYDRWATLIDSNNKKSWDITNVIKEDDNVRVIASKDDLSRIDIDPYYRGAIGKVIEILPDHDYEYSYGGLYTGRVYVHHHGATNTFPYNKWEDFLEVVDEKLSFETIAANDAMVEKFIKEAQPGQIWYSRSGFALVLSPNHPIEYERKNDNKLILKNAVWMKPENKSDVDLEQDFGTTIVDENMIFHYVCMVC